jgi:hypothetical protein
MNHAIADALVPIHEIRRLSTRCLLGIQNMPMLERQTAQPHEGVDLQPKRVVVGHAEKIGIGVERKQGRGANASSNTERRRLEPCVHGCKWLHFKTKILNAACARNAGLH